MVNINGLEKAYFERQKELLPPLPYGPSGFVDGGVDKITTLEGDPVAANPKGYYYLPRGEYLLHSKFPAALFGTVFDSMVGFVRSSTLRTGVMFDADSLTINSERTLAPFRVISPFGTLVHQQARMLSVLPVLNSKVWDTLFYDFQPVIMNWVGEYIAQHYPLGEASEVERYGAKRAFNQVRRGKPMQFAASPLQAEYLQFGRQGVIGQYRTISSLMPYENGMPWREYVLRQTAGRVSMPRGTFAYFEPYICGDQLIATSVADHGWEGHMMMVGPTGEMYDRKLAPPITLESSMTSPGISYALHGQHAGSTRGPLIPFMGKQA